MTKRLIVNRTRNNKDQLLVVEQVYDDIGLGITPSKKSIINFDSNFNSEKEIKDFIEANNWIFRTLPGEVEFCEMIFVEKMDD
jgi:hypothetical protein